MKNQKCNAILFLFAILFSILNIRCESVLESVFNGVVSGTVKSGNGFASGGDASVTQTVGKTDDPDGPLIIIDSTRADANGDYRFNNVTTGLKTFVYRIGLFADTITIDIRSDGTYQNINSSLQLDTATVKLAYLFGERDSIQAIVRQMGYPIHQLQVSDFNDLNTLLQYRYIFINSGDSSRFNLNSTQISVNISEYLDQGGMLYVSDWAIECLKPLYDLPGTFSGNGQTISSAGIVDPELSAYSSLNTAQINYQVNNWYSLDSINNCNCIKPYLMGSYSITQGSTTSTVTNIPLAFYNDVGVNGGKFIFTTFRNESAPTANVLKILQFYVFQLD